MTRRSTGFALAIGMLLQSAVAIAAEGDPWRWWSPAARPAQQALERGLLESPDPVRLRAMHDLVCEEPHPACTEADQRMIEKLSLAFAELGLQVEVQDLWVYIAEPVSAAVDVVSWRGRGETDEKISLPLQEVPVAGDPQSAHAELGIGWNAYSGSGDVTAGVVYANYGTREDFDLLAARGVAVRGKIVMARYGRSFRGFKVRFAEAAGAAGVILYTDPEDSGYRRGLPYPDGGWSNGSSIQRGSIKTLPYPGDPLTPGAAAEKSAPRTDPKTLALPKIPVQPMGWDAANQILSRMSGTPAPSAWQGALPHHYRIEGGDELQVRLQVHQPRRLKPTANVLGSIEGAVTPEEKVILGCHFDAWTFGSGDPHAGTILLYECARAFAELADAGVRPARTIVFANWGAEEFGIIGSTEYCEAYAHELREHAVAYINLDMAAMGMDFRASAAPILRSVIEGAYASAVQSAADKPLEFGDLGGGSDHVGFYCHLGIPSCGLGARGAQGVSYHTNYETLPWYRQVVGEDYASAVQLTRIVSILTARLAFAEVLPFDTVAYTSELRRHLAKLGAAVESPPGAVDAAEVGSLGQARRRLDARIAQLEQEARTMHARLHAAIESGKLSAQARAAVNRELRTMERCWLVEEGLPQRPWYRSLYAATDPYSGYAAWTLPALRLAVEQQGGVGLELDRITTVVDRLCAKVTTIDAVLDGVLDDDKGDGADKK